VDLTASYVDHFPDDLRARYDFVEVRNAAAVLQVTNPAAMADVSSVLERFALQPDDLLVAGGNESALAARLNQHFRELGWREGQVDTEITLLLRLLPYRPAGEVEARVVETTTKNPGYLVDNVRDRVALDVEWNAKDGNLDRDLGAYRALYDAGLIDGAIMITRTQDDLRTLGRTLALAAGWTAEAARRILNTTTTTNVEKLRPRLTRGAAGGCPVLGVLICSRTLAD